MAGLEVDPALFHQAHGFFRTAGHALEDQGPDDGTPKGAGHAFPGDGRAGMEDQVLAHTRDNVDGPAHAYQVGAGLYNALSCRAVGVFYVHG
jgi:hypothetical protein